MPNIHTLARDQPSLVYETLSQSANCIVWTDQQSKLIMANKAYMQLSGFKDLDRLVGQEYKDQPSEGCEFDEPWKEQDHLVFRSHKEVRLLSHVQPNDRQERVLLLGIKSPARDEQNNIIGLVHEYINITHCHANLFMYTLQKSARKYFFSNEGGAFTCSLAENFEHIPSKVYLTARQSECLFFLLRGKTCKQIADIICRSSRTVEKFVEQLLDKLNCHSKSELIDKAVKYGFHNLVPISIINKYVS